MNRLVVHDDVALALGVSCKRALRSIDREGEGLRGHGSSCRVGRTSVSNQGNSTGDLNDWRILNEGRKVSNDFAHLTPPHNGTRRANGPGFTGLLQDNVLLITIVKRLRPTPSSNNALSNQIKNFKARDAANLCSPRGLGIGRPRCRAIFFMPVHVSGGKRA